MGKSVEVGDELTFKVTAIHGDEIQVECDPSAADDTDNEEEETQKPEGDTAEPPSEDDSGEPVAAPAGAGDMYD